MQFLRLSLLSILIVLTPRRSSTQDTDVVDAKERQALVALYNSTGGANWVHKQGWLGPFGSECNWYGVGCGRAASGQRTIRDLDLPSNGLAGRIPSGMDSLEGLKRLVLRGNNVEGPLPEGLLRKFDDGYLEIEPLSLIHDVREIVYSSNNPSTLCSGFKATFMADGSVQLERRLCPANSNQTELEDCEHRDGKTRDFDMLARFLVRSGFFSPREDSEANRGSDLEQLTLTATRRSIGAVSRMWTPPPSFAEWSFSVAINGVIRETRWNGSPARIACSARAAPNPGVSR